MYNVYRGDAVPIRLCLTAYGRTMTLFSGKLSHESICGQKTRLSAKRFHDKIPFRGRLLDMAGTEEHLRIGHPWEPGRCGKAARKPGKSYAAREPAGKLKRNGQLVVPSLSTLNWWHKRRDLRWSG